jgi:hypothetical protein
MGDSVTGHAVRMLLKNSLRYLFVSKPVNALIRDLTPIDTWFPVPGWLAPTRRELLFRRMLGE